MLIDSRTIVQVLPRDTVSWKWANMKAWLMWVTVGRLSRPSSQIVTGDVVYRPRPVVADTQLARHRGWHVMVRLISSSLSAADVCSSRWRPDGCRCLRRRRGLINATVVRRPLTKMAANCQIFLRNMIRRGTQESRHDDAAVFVVRTTKLDKTQDQSSPDHQHSYNYVATTITSIIIFNALNQNV